MTRTFATAGCFSSSVPKTPLDIFFLSYANVSATSSTAAISGPRNSTEPAFFAFAASVELKSSTIGMVHVVPLTSLPEDMTDSKSACPKNPSSGLNIPSAIFSISLWIDAETLISSIPATSIFECPFTSAPPCGCGIPLISYSPLFWYNSCAGHTRCVPDFPTTIDRPVNLHQVLWLECMGRIQY